MCRYVCISRLSGFFLVACFANVTLHAEVLQPASGAPLYFREDWKETPAALPVTQEHVAAEGLRLHVYGSAGDRIKKSHHDELADDPYYIWSGECRGSWALTLSRADSAVDFSAGGVIRWRSRQNGERFPRVLIRLADGAFYVSDQTDTNSQQWHVFSFILERVTWSAFDMTRFVPLPGGRKPNLSKVVEIGVTDLEPGGGAALCSRIDWIEVYGQPARIRGKRLSR